MRNGDRPCNGDADELSGTRAAGDEVAACRRLLRIAVFPASKPPSLVLSRPQTTRGGGRI